MATLSRGGACRCARLRSGSSALNAFLLFASLKRFSVLCSIATPPRRIGLCPRRCATFSTEDSSRPLLAGGDPPPWPASFHSNLRVCVYPERRSRFPVYMHADQRQWANVGVCCWLSLDCCINLSALQCSATSLPLHFPLPHPLPLPSPKPAALSLGHPGAERGRESVRTEEQRPVSICGWWRASSDNMQV